MLLLGYGSWSATFWWIQRYCTVLKYLQNSRLSRDTATLTPGFLFVYPSKPYRSDLDRENPSDPATGLCFSTLEANYSNNKKSIICILCAHMCAAGEMFFLFSFSLLLVANMIIEERHYCRYRQILLWDFFWGGGKRNEWTCLQFIVVWQTRQFFLNKFIVIKS